MFTAAQKWKELREAGEVKAPLRQILCLCLLTELEARTDPAKLTEETKTHFENGLYQGRAVAQPEVVLRGKQAADGH